MNSSIEVSPQSRVTRLVSRFKALQDEVIELEVVVNHFNRERELNPAPEVFEATPVTLRETLDYLEHGLAEIRDELVENSNRLREVLK